MLCAASVEMHLETTLKDCYQDLNIKVQTENAQEAQDESQLFM